MSKRLELVGAEPEENLGLRYMTSTLEREEHRVRIVPFNKERRTLLVCPRRHGRKVETGVFSCRSPSHPNPICLCVVELLKVEGCVLTVKGLDAEVGSPIVDIKPYVPHSDSVPDAKVADWVMKGPPT